MNLRKSGTVVDFLLEGASENPEKTAIALADGREISFGQLAGSVLSTAADIGALDLPPASRVALGFREGEWIDYAIAYLATLLSGATAVVLPTDAQLHTLRLICRDYGTALVLHPAGDAPPQLGIAARVVGAGGGTPGGQGAPRLRVAGPDTLADIVFTSGSTGTPKGVAATHADLLRIARGYRNRPGAAVLAHGISHSTAIGTRQLLLSTMVRGATMAACVPFETRAFLAMAAARSASTAVVPAATGRHLARALNESPGVRPDALRVLRLVSDYLRPEIHRDLAASLPGARVINAYGLTEAGDAHLVVAEEDCDLGPGGHPAPGTEAAIMDEAGALLPPGEEGYVCLRDQKTSLSYPTDPFGTVATWRDGWTLTGDRGRIDASGRVRLTGRDYGLAGIGGKTVSVASVKAALESLPGVEAAAVVALPHPTLGQTLAAAVETTGDPAEADVESLADRLAGTLPGHAIPSPLVAVGAMPLSRNGKPHQESVLRLVQQQLASASRPCETPTERLVAHAWERVLDLAEPPGAESDFFQLGGDSMSALEIAVELENELGVDLPSNALFTASTPAGLARVLDGLRQQP